MKCVEFEELVENFTCDSATIDYLRNISFTSGGAEVLFVDLDQVEADHPERDSLIEQWEHFISESEDSSGDDIQEDEHSGEKEEGIHNQLTELREMIKEQALLLTQLQTTQRQLIDARKADISDGLSAEVDEVEKMLDRQRDWMQKLEGLYGKFMDVEAGLLEKAQRIESYIAHPHRDWLLYGIVFLVILLQGWIVVTG